MFKSKSFNLITKEDLKKSKSPKKYSWTKCLIVPILIGFVLTLILLNVDFSGDQSDRISTESLHSTFVTDTSIVTEPLPGNEVDSTLGVFFTTQMEYNFLKLIKNVSAKTESLSESNQLNDESSQLVKRFGDICTEKSNPCILSCSGSSDEKALNKRLEDQYKKCQSDMDLTLQGLIIRMLGKHFLNGNFHLKKLSFFNNILDAIDNNAFNKPSLKYLEKLIIADSTITKMNSLTFQGLESLQHFEILNKETLIALDAKEFLTPIAGTLTRIIIKHSSLTKAYDPTPWLDGQNFVMLTDVDLSDNNFPDTLHKHTFQKLVGVKYLHLRNCRITHFAENTFLKVKDTLQNLDLSRNLFKTLNADFLLSMSDTNIIISLSYNIWDCSCHSDEFVENIKNTKIIFEQEPKCSTPPHLTGIEIKAVSCCEVDQAICEAISTTISTTETKILTEQIPATTSTTKVTDKNSESINIELVCRSTIDNNVSIMPIKEQYVAYNIHSVSPTSIAIELKVSLKKFQLIYLVPQRSKSIKSIEIIERVTIMNDLIASQDYIFCAIPPNNQNFSLFNCHSHHTGLNVNYKGNVWLKVNHMPLFMSLTFLGIVVFLFIGAIIVFFILRWRPTLLKGSKRLFIFDTGSKQVFLSKENATLPTEELYEALRTYASFYNTPMLNLNNSDYLQYISGMDKHIIQTIYNGRSFAPVQRAPAMPPVDLKRTLSELSTIPANDAISLESISENTDEHEYQCLELYQQIY